MTETAGAVLADVRTDKNGRRRLPGLLRQSLFGRLAGYEDVNDADTLCRDPTMRPGDRAMFVHILSLIARLRAAPAPA